MTYKHRPVGFISAAVLAVPLAVGLIACQSETVVNEKPSVTPHSNDITSTGEAHFLSDENGNVPRQIPPAVLAEIIQELKGQGQDVLVADIQARYNLKTGMVLDLVAAEKAESFLKSKLPSAKPESPIADAMADRKPPTPEYGMPPELKSHFSKYAKAVEQSIEVAQ
jgi:hypothetical protein